MSRYEIGLWWWRKEGQRRSEHRRQRNACEVFSRATATRGLFFTLSGGVDGIDGIDVIERGGACKDSSSLGNENLEQRDLCRGSTWVGAACLKKAFPLFYFDV